MRGEPFADFSHFASDLLTTSTLLKVPNSITLNDFKASLNIKLNRQYPGARASVDVSAQLFSFIKSSGSEGIQLSILLSHFPKHDVDLLRNSVSWLAKMGLVTWIN